MEAILFLKITINFIIFNINSLVCLYHHVYVFKVLLQLYTLKKSKSLNKKNKKNMLIICILTDTRGKTMCL